MFIASVGLTAEDFNRVADECMANVDNRYELLEYVRIEGTQLLEEQLDVMPGLLNLLAYLDRMQIAKAVATTTFREKTYERLDRMGLLDRFDYILCGDEVHKRKPDPEIYCKVISHFNVKPENALVLEDSVYGVESACRAGIPCIMIPSVVPPADKQRKEASAIAESLHDVRKMLIKSEG
jgi:HAD superfamily hydrolase (TIGR01509 family)